MQIDLRNRILGRLGLVILAFSLLTVAVQPAPAHAAPAAEDAVIYIVRPGDRLADIAVRYKTSVSAIARANHLVNADVIYPGQRLVIPGSAAPSNPTPTPSSGSSNADAVVSHTVKLGDTLEKIARAYGVSTSVIVQANGITNPNVIWVGQQLAIPGGSAAPKPAAATSTPKPAVTAPSVHVVQAGETLSQIAQRYGTTVAALVATNGLGSADIIRVGMRLTIPKPGAQVAYLGQASRFVVSISQQRCWLYRGETLLSQWVCSTGRAGSGTRPGTYRIQSKMPKAYGSTWNIWMPFWLGIYWAGASENGIHGLPWNATTGVQVWTGYVGTPITYGCVMLDNVNAKMLYDMAYIGMPVIIKP